MKQTIKKIAYAVGILFAVNLVLVSLIHHFETPAERARREQAAIARADERKSEEAAIQQRAADRDEAMKRETAAKIANIKLAGQRETVQTMAHDYVLGSLKAPKTATFADHSDVRNLGKGTYEVSSYVDSQNSFGAMIRTHYAITLKTDDGERFHFLNTRMF
jgi:membrane protein involved in colicin uptake